MGKKLKVLVVNVKGKHGVKTLDTPFFETLRKEVGGYIEIVRPLNAIRSKVMKTGMCLVINEEGRIIGLPLNIFGTFIYGSTIVGNVIVCREGYTDEGMDLISLEDEDIEFLKQYLD